MVKYGIFGGTFNPPHIAHSIVADSVRQQLKLDKIIFIPSGNPPLKESISAKHRLAMSELAFGNDRNFEISKIEIQNNNEKSYTVNTLEILNEMNKKEEVMFYLILGADKLIELPKWKDPQRIIELCNVIVINRPDYSVKDSKTEFSDKVKFVTVPFLEISSSMIREFISKGKSVKYLVCKEVEDYIYKNNLYIL